MSGKQDPTKAMLILVCGLQGAGKTTVAKRIATIISALILRTDVIRKQLWELRRYRRPTPKIFLKASYLKFGPYTFCNSLPRRRPETLSLIILMQFESFRVS